MDDKYIEEVLKEYTIEEILELNDIDPIEFIKRLVEGDELVLPVV